jgi:hypothetical protein
MNRRLYSWVVLGCLLAAIPGCDLTDIGSPNDMAKRQELMRQNRSIPSATEMPPGLGEDLPAPTTRPVSANQ